GQLGAGGDGPGRRVDLDRQPVASAYEGLALALLAEPPPDQLLPEQVSHLLPGEDFEQLERRADVVLRPDGVPDGFADPDPVGSTHGWSSPGDGPSPNASARPGLEKCVSTT